MKIQNPTVFLKYGELFCLTTEIKEPAPLYSSDRASEIYKSMVAPAKSSAVKVNNNEEIVNVIWDHFADQNYGPGNTITLTGYEAEVKCSHNYCTTDRGCEDCKVATITPIHKDSGEWNASPKKKIPLAERLEKISQKLRNKHSTTVEEMDLHEAFKFGQNSPIHKEEESQEELWYEVVKIVESNFKGFRTSKLMKHFTITRKPIK